MNKFIPINLNAIVTLPSGAPAVINDQPLSLRIVLGNSLGVTSELDAALGLEDRLYRVLLAEVVKSQPSISISLSDVVILTTLIQRAFTHPSVVVFFLRHIDEYLQRLQVAVSALTVSEVIQTQSDKLDTDNHA